MKFCKNTIFSDALILREDSKSILKIKELEEEIKKLKEELKVKNKDIFNELK